MAQAFPPKVMEEFNQHSDWNNEYMMKQLKGADPDVIIQASSLMRLLSQHGGDVPPDRITAKVFRILADGIDYASEKLGKDPDLCTEYRNIMRNQALEQAMERLAKQQEQRNAATADPSAPDEDVWDTDVKKGVA